MRFLEQLLARQNGINTRFDADIGGAFGGLVGGIAARGVAKERAKTRAVETKIAQRRAARDLRYQIGLGKVQAAAMGGSYGDGVFRAAENARAVEERLQDIALAAKFEDIDEAAQVPSGLQLGLGFAGDVANAYARRSASVSRYEVRP